MHDVLILLYSQDDVEYDKDGKVKPSVRDLERAVHPYILRINHGDHFSYCILVEKCVIASMITMAKALNVLMAVHYVFNIQDVKQLKGVYLFLQHNYFEILEKKLLVELHTLIARQSTC